MTDPAAAASPGHGWDCHVHVFDAAAPVRAGHYRPAHRPLAQIETEAAKAGVGHLVLVQPSVYGSDNRLLLDALAVEPGRHRGVVVLDDRERDAEDDRALDAMARLGVRGARLNLQSPVGEAGGGHAAGRSTGIATADRLRRLLPRLRARGWHLQWYAAAAQLADIAAWHEDQDVPCVLDHLGGLTAASPPHDPAWQALDRLAGQGAWIKLSGWYRLRSAAPHADLHAHIRRVADRFGDRMVWGSDWPHTAFAPDAMPGYRSVWQPVVDALGHDAAMALRDRTPPVYR